MSALGSFSDLSARNRDVRSTPMSRIRQPHASLPKAPRTYEFIRSLRRRGHVAAALQARPDIGHAQIHQRAMELALPLGRRCEVGFPAMLEQAGACGKYRIERQARLLQRHGPKKSNIEVRTLSGGQAIRADV